MEDRGQNHGGGYLCLLIVIPLLAYGEFRDPTKPANAPINLPATIGISKLRLHLSAIWITPKSRYATINGILVKSGQTILKEVTVLKINTNSVELMQNGKLQTLELLQRPYTLSR